MKKTRASWLASTLGLLIALGLLAGCYRPAAPDVTLTPAAIAEGVQPAEGTPDIVASAQAESARATQLAGGAQVAETPTEPLPTPTQTLAPTTAAGASGTATPTLAPTSTPTPSPSSTPTSAATSTGQTRHTVQRGENLFRIALRYGTTVGAIASVNGIANPALIYVGQVLIIPSSGGQPPSPGGTTYTVQPGDNLFRIALRYNMGYTYLAQYNGIANPAHIYVGQVLRIPPR